MTEKEIADRALKRIWADLQRLEAQTHLTPKEREDLESLREIWQWLPSSRREAVARQTLH
jgi:hypothetical protein